MSKRIPHHALSFSVQATKLAAQHGLKAGLAKAAARANPILLVLGTADSILDAVHSWMNLKEARTHLDGMTRTLPKEEAALAIDLRKLKEEVTLARDGLRQQQALRERIGRINLLCAQICQEILHDLLVIRNADIPDVTRFEQLSEELEIAWTKMREALDYYNQTTE